MAILRTLWRVLVGVKDLMVLLVLLLFFGALWIGLNSRQAVRVPDGGALVLALDGAIVDQATESSAFDAATGSSAGREVQMRDLLGAIARARSDSRIKGLVLDLDTFVGAGEANLQAIGGALDAFRKSGKPVHAYATAYTDAGYSLAAHANRIWLSPLGAVLITGPGGSGLYFKQALAKLDVDIEVFKVGTYKAAVEPFTRQDQSPEAKAANQALVDSLWATWLADVKRARPAADVSGFLAALPQRIARAGGDQAVAARDAGLVDEIAGNSAFHAAMTKLFGEGDSQRFGSYKGITLARYIAATRSVVPESGDAVGVVYVTGDIVDGDAPRGTAGGTTIARAIAGALDDDDIKALVVRIDSGGGSVLASEEIRQALLAAKAKGLPVVASFGPVAASGGYWVATAADEIYAQPSTITGSIGVFAIIPSFPRSLAALGIGTDGVKTTPYSGEPDILRGLGPETRVILQASVEDIYRRFTTIVGAARKLPLAEVDRIGQGRVWAGSTAKSLKLVDQFGDLDAAVAAAARKAGIKGTPRIVAVEKPTSPYEQFFASLAPDPDAEADAMVARDPYARLIAASRRRLLTAVGDVRALAGGPVMQASCLECAGMGSPRLGRARDGGAVLGQLATLGRR
ncbi:hypothetical protein IP88_15425 [alpha proteobacterium AAP81b]|nr:hypothetical protein IP88_15425 [alpha proteobacterium AAP81b]